MTLDELKKEHSLPVRSGIVVVWPQYANRERILDVSEVEGHVGTYCINNGTVVFVDNDGVYVTPYTGAKVRALHKNNFRPRSLYVPFSNWDYPKEKEDEWARLRKEAFAVTQSE